MHIVSDQLLSLPIIGIPLGIAGFRMVPLALSPRVRRSCRSGLLDVAGSGCQHPTAAPVEPAQTVRGSSTTPTATPTPPVTKPPTTEDFFKPVLHGFAQALAHMPIWTLILLGTFAALAIADSVRVSYWKAAPKDPNRLFGSADRATILRRAGNRCEHHSGSGRRCRATGNLHADHVHPHSRGGTTTVGNAQALCSRHNKQKAAHIPFKHPLRGIEKRRAAYFAPGESGAVVRREPSSSRRG